MILIPDDDLRAGPDLLKQAIRRTRREATKGYDVWGAEPGTFHKCGVVRQAYTLDEVTHEASQRLAALRHIQKSVR